MNKWLRNKKGVTVLEGVIALGLLAVVTAGSFGVLLASSRQASQPDMREEMALSIEKANDKLKAMLLFADENLTSESVQYLSTSYQVNTSEVYNLCPGEDANDGLEVNVDHSIKCLLPPICDSAHSTFTYNFLTITSSYR